jgi:hypothetical protein
LAAAKHKKSLSYQIKLKGLDSPSGSISIRALKDVCELFTSAAERGLRLAIEGSSVRPGRLPNWLTKTLDLTVTGLAKGSTVLNIEAPFLGATAKDRIRQQDFWYVVPQPDDTAFSLLAKSVHDTTAEQLDSDAYDAGVLDSLLQFKGFLKGSADRIELRCRARRGENFALGNKEIDKIQRLKAKTPEPRAYVLSGHLDAIEHSRRRFHLVLGNGESVLGAVDTAYVGVEDMRQYWGQNATVKGIVHFRPSGKPRLIEAQLIKTMAEGEEVFDALAQVQTEASFLKELKEGEIKKGWLKDVWGQWPGDEPIEDLLAALNNN